ncbi:MAG: hypothetical protein K8I00_12780 [Candidatus Omnitrophica bacterium]|nr:hypothetical protein [Candidatus Omnitrophota bacterium]
MQKFIDFVRLAKLRHGYAIFLRRQFDSHRVFSIIIKLARVYRRVILRKPCIVAVVGSLGKTTATRAVWAALGGPIRQPSFSNYGSCLALNLMAVRPWDSHSVLEAGISRPGMMDANLYILKPHIAVVTSIAWEHFRSFKSLEDIRVEKVKMVRALPADGFAILNGDDPNVRWMATQTQAAVIFFGFDEKNDIRLLDFSYDWPQGMTGRVAYQKDVWEVRTRFFGRHFWYSVLAGLATAVVRKTDIRQALERIAALPPTPKRFESIYLDNDRMLIDDTHKGGLDSYWAALDALEQVHAKRKIVLFGDIEDPPGARAETYRDWGKRIGEVADMALFYGFGADLIKARSSARQTGMKPENTLILKTDYFELIQVLRGMIRPGDVILIKGRGSYRLQRVVLALQGRAVTCPLKICEVKVNTCGECPMLEKNSPDFQNHYILPYIKS